MRPLAARYPDLEAAPLALRTQAVLARAGFHNLRALALLRRGRGLSGIPGLTLTIRQDISGALDEIEGEGLEPAQIGGGGLMGLDRAHGPVEADDGLRALHSRLDYYPTEPWAGRAVAELIREVDPLARSIHEPAAGEGHLVHGLRSYFEDVQASDIYGHGGRVETLRDYLGPDTPGDDADWVVTNPPFEGAEPFVRRALSRARRGVAILQRLTWIETIGRDELFFGDQPLTLKASFAERIQMRLGVWDPKGSGQTPCAWYLWMKPDCHAPSRDPRVQAAWGLNTYVGLRFPPGTKRRLTDKTDAEKFGGRL